MKLDGRRGDGHGEAGRGRGRLAAATLVAVLAATTGTASGLTVPDTSGVPAGATRATDRPVADAEVGMTNELTFTPEEITVTVGETVRWNNGSLLVHTVTADPEQATREGSVRLPEGAEPFDSGNLAPGESFRHTFEVPGTYVYFCIPHEGAKMIGTVHVEPADG